MGRLRGLRLEGGWGRTDVGRQGLSGREDPKVGGKAPEDEGEATDVYIS